MIADTHERLTGRPTVRQRQELSERILIAAKQQFLMRGYNDTTFALIASAGSTSRGALYNRYVDKAALFGQVVETEIHEMCARAALVFDDQVDVMESLVLQAEQMITVATEPEHLALYRIITGDAPRTSVVDDALRAAWILFASHMETYFERQMANGRLKVRDRRNASEMFLGLVFQPVFVSIVYGMPQASPEKIPDHIKRSVLLFLGGIGLVEMDGPRPIAES